MDISECGAPPAETISANVSAALEVLRAETAASFEWLARPALRSASVDFFPNPGNVGDAVINLACRKFLESVFSTVNVLSVDDRASCEHVFIGGGGNLVEGSYREIATVLERLDPHQNAYLFPVSVVGFTDLLGARRERLRLLCREPVTFETLETQLPEASLRLTHDAAFFLSRRDLLGGDGPSAATRKPIGVYMRRDAESVATRPRGFDLTGQHISNWTDGEEIAKWVGHVAETCLQHDTLVTDRLHTAIVAALLQRRVALLPNSYFKNRAVYEASLSRLGSVSFEPSCRAALRNARRSLTPARSHNWFSHLLSRRRFLALAATAACVTAPNGDDIVLTEDGWVIRADDVSSGLLAKLSSVPFHDRH